LVEIVIHGRGGQGSVVASEILAAAFFKEGKQVQAFPSFGSERRGAPVAAFLRADDKPILLRCQIDNPDVLIILDPTLVDEPDLFGSLKKGGWVLANTNRDLSTLDYLKDFQVASVDATGIAVRNGLGSPTTAVVNTGILGAFAKFTGMVKLESILDTLEEFVRVKLKENAVAARQAYESVKF
jgi:2-oxoacid:acceptor oxidoreductase gamma subunit (pyruvate/2-ketoisovalerate family)